MTTRATMVSVLTLTTVGSFGGLPASASPRAHEASVRVTGTATLKLVRTTLSGTLVQAGPVTISRLGRGSSRVVSHSQPGGKYVTTVTISSPHGTLRAHGHITLAPDGTRYTVSGTTRVTAATGQLQGAIGSLKVTGHGTFSPAKLKLRLSGSLTGLG
jgi:hypothetical protein